MLDNVCCKAKNLCNSTKVKSHYFHNSYGGSYNQLFSTCKSPRAIYREFGIDFVFSPKKKFGNFRKFSNMKHNLKSVVETQSDTCNLNKLALLKFQLYIF